MLVFATVFKTGFEGKKPAPKKKEEKVERRTFDGSTILPKPWLKSSIPDGITK